MRIHSIYRFFFFTILILGSLLACEKEELNRPFARVRTLPVTEVDSTGATFHAEVIDFNEEAITDYGFIWTTYPQKVINLPPNRFSYRSLGANPSEKEFSVRIEAGLEPGVVYYVRAYLRSAKNTVYGEEVIFSSAGGFAPIIEKVLPEILTPGDTMTIIGKYYIGIKEQGKVWVGNAATEVIASTTTEIRCIVPRYVTDSTPIVVESNTGQRSTAYTIPKISTPELYQLIPNEVVNGDTLTITGRYFSPKKDWNEIISENVGGTFNILNVTPTRLQFIASTRAFVGNARLQVRVGFQTSATGLDFSIAAPVIEDFYPKEVTVGDTLTIVGRNFSQISLENRITFNDSYDGYWGHLNSVTSTKELKILITELPIGLEGSITGKISVAVGGKKSTSQATLTYLNRDWKRIDELPVSISYKPLGFVLQDKIYFSDGNGNDWWTYSLSSRNWQMAPQIPQVGSEGFTTVVALTAGEEAFLIQRNSVDNALRCWRYRPGIVWTRVSDLRLPQGVLVTDPLVAFAVGSEIFVCLSGRENSCWKLNVTSGTWSPISNYNPLLTPAHDGYIPVPLAALSFNQKGYLLSPNSPPLLLLEYNPTTNNWLKLEEVSSPPRQHSAFAYKNKIYFLALNSNGVNAIELNPFTGIAKTYPLHTPPSEVSFEDGQALVLSNRVFFAIGKYLYEWFPR